MGCSWQLQSKERVTWIAGPPEWAELQAGGVNVKLCAYCFRLYRIPEDWHQTAGTEDLPLKDNSDESSSSQTSSSSSSSSD